MDLETFDTHTFHKKLVATGFTEEQSDVVLEILKSRNVLHITKQDLTELRVELKKDMGALNTDVKALTVKVDLILTKIVPLFLGQTAILGLFITILKFF